MRQHEGFQQHVKPAVLAWYGNGSGTAYSEPSPDRRRIVRQVQHVTHTTRHRPFDLVGLLVPCEINCSAKGSPQFTVVVESWAIKQGQ